MVCVVGKMSNDTGIGRRKVLWCCSYLDWLLLGDFIPIRMSFQYFCDLCRFFCRGGGEYGFATAAYT